MGEGRIRGCLAGALEPGQGSPPTGEKGRGERRILASHCLAEGGIGGRCGEFELEVLSKRVKAAMDRARRQSVHIGRPTTTARPGFAERRAAAVRSPLMPITQSGHVDHLGEHSGSCAVQGRDR